MEVRLHTFYTHYLTEVSDNFHVPDTLPQGIFIFQKTMWTSEPFKIIMFEVSAVNAKYWLQIHLGLAVNWLT
jgi:hypothetical protein